MRNVSATECQIWHRLIAVCKESWRTAPLCSSILKIKAGFKFSNILDAKFGACKKLDITRALISWFSHFVLFLWERSQTFLQFEHTTSFQQGRESVTSVCKHAWWINVFVSVCITMPLKKRKVEVKRCHQQIKCCVFSENYISHAQMVNS